MERFRMGFFIVIGPVHVTKVDHASNYIVCLTAADCPCLKILKLQLEIF